MPDWWYVFSIPFIYTYIHIYISRSKELTTLFSNCLGFQIKKGWILNVDARAIHYDPKIYEDPTKFNPSRFEEDARPYSFLAFGVGGRSCLGMNLAKAMMLVFLYRLMTNFRWIIPFSFYLWMDLFWVSYTFIFIIRWRVTDKDSSLEKWGIFPRLRTGCPVHVTPIETEHASL